MPTEISEDLCWRVVYLYNDDFSITDIANTLYVKENYLVEAEMCILQNLVKDKVDWYLDELVYEMENLTGKRVSVSALWRSLYYLGITRKKLQKAAYERSELMRAHYLG
ncbi:hypothetical protein RhiirA5_439060, partial [Rhizophagus irregularis]